MAFENYTNAERIGTVTDFLAHRHPVLAVPCPTCRARAGLWCIRPSGHRAADFHTARKAEADRVFIDQHGPDASIARTVDGWAVDPEGRASIRPRPVDDPCQGRLL